MCCTCISLELLQLQTVCNFYNYVYTHNSVIKQAMLALITGLVASGILSIKRAAQDATFDPEISIQALVTSSFISCTKTAQKPLKHMLNIRANTRGRGIYIPGCFFLSNKLATKKSN